MGVTSGGNYTAPFSFDTIKLARGLTLNFDDISISQIVPAAAIDANQILVLDGSLGNGRCHTEGFFTTSAASTKASLKTLTLEFKAKFTSLGSDSFYLGLADSGWADYAYIYHSAGVFAANKVKLKHGDTTGGNEETAELLLSTPTSWHTYKIIIRVGYGTYFYVDDVLAGSLTTVAKVPQSVAMAIQNTLTAVGGVGKVEIEYIKVLQE